MLYGSPYGRYGEAAFGGSTSPKDGGSAVSGPSDDVIALRHLRAGGGDCVGRSIARWSSFMHVSVYLEAESPCQFPVFQTTHFGALVRLLFHELLGLQLRRLLRWSSIGAREGHQRSLSMTQPSLGPRTARRHRERPNQQIRRVADHQARPAPELQRGGPGLGCGRPLKSDMA